MSPEAQWTANKGSIVGTGSGVQGPYGHSADAQCRFGRIVGPLTDGRGWAFGSPLIDRLGARGYRLEEYLIEGTACAYDPMPGAEIGEDGHWRSFATRPAQYTTRLVVVRPVDEGRFNGRVVVNWQNVTLGVDLGTPFGEEMFRQGYVWVGATVQEMAINGLDVIRPGNDAGPTPPPGLREWDPVRYGSLSHPGDEYSFDMFAQIVRAVKGEHPQGLNPLGGLSPRTVIATGDSQSAMFLGAYINMAHAHDRLVDGYLLLVHWGVCWWPEKTEVSMSPLGVPVGSQRIRDDQRVPIMVVNSESEAISMFPVMQPDSDTFRFWDVAGACHSGNPNPDESLDIFDRDGIDVGQSNSAGGNFNTIDWTFIQDASLRRMAEWIEQGVAPPRSVPITITAGLQPEVARDSRGNALGGIRIPEIEVPVAAQSGLGSSNSFDRFHGERRVFDDATINRLYPSRRHYLEQYDAAVERLRDSGALLLEDVPSLRDRGRQLAAGLPADASD